MSLATLRDHLSRGGAATLNHPATYAVAEGAVIAPARYAGRSGSEFVFETRYVDGGFARTVLIDSKGSQSNRAEEGLLTARREVAAAERIPVIEVRYPSRTLTDLELPHRAVDAHIRASTRDGVDTVKTEWYRALRDATAVDLSPLFLASPATLAFGGWDSSRRRGQLRLRSLFVSELFGVVSEQEDGRVSRRSGGRLDPLGQDFHLTPDEFQRLLDVQRDEMGERTVRTLERRVAAARRNGRAETISASPLNLGGVPPSTETPFGVSVPAVRRARTYSLAGLRRLRFGGTAEDDAKARTALLAMLLLGAAYADADPEIRAYCDLSAPRGRVLLDDREAELDLSIDACAAFLEEAIADLPERLAWTGQTISLDGEPSLDRAATATADDADA
ncbi:type I-G CRISPR-associated RAMP protein Csb1/Cas7g [Conexibacter arvalis]|uniref:CRISPR-associated protein Csb1 n=1 Tax=Conexibacter arvalis TaxID=912552 RepID=A0A840IEP4_9ACTN|nr:type I-U CRISPR-associated RAMP protein Csb1/Cas7u [Conexibacter arvalis]MBB4663299.1 CRISPR-associated protein Csb1 [Conexibacter arvalis]